MNKTPVAVEIRQIRDLITSGKTAEAIERCQVRLDEEPGKDSAPFLLLMAMVSYYNNDEGLGVQLMERAHLIDPDCRDYVEALANMCTRIGRVTDGLYYGKLATALRPNALVQDLLPPEMTSYRDSLDHIGVSQHALNAESAINLGLFDDAIVNAGQELRIDPYHLGSMHVLAKALTATGGGDAAASAMKGAMHVNPRAALHHALMAEALIAAGRHDDALVHQLTGLDLVGEDDGEALARLAATAWYQPSGSFQAVQPIIARYTEEAEAPRRAVTAEQPHNGMVGVAWDQCHDGPLVDFVLPVLRQIGNTVLYNLTVRKDPYTDMLRNAATRPRSSAGIDPATLGRIMAGDGLVCLINLCAPAQHAVFPRFKGSRKPLNVHWLNMPMTDSIPNTDLVLSGPETADLDERSYGADKVIRMRNLLAVQFPHSLAPEEEIQELPRTERGFATFGVAAEPARLTGETIALLAQALWATPGAHLLLGGRVNWEGPLTDRVFDAFSRFGLSDRIHFQQPAETPGDPATLFFNQIDVMLDTTPQSGSREVARALWMGVPVVTLRGERRAGRLGASILHAAGRTEWIAGSPAEYVDIASRLAASPDLAATRAGLRDQVLGSPLANVTDMARQVAEALRISIVAITGLS